MVLQRPSVDHLPFALTAENWVVLATICYLFLRRLCFARFSHHWRLGSFGLAASDGDRSFCDPASDLSLGRWNSNIVLFCFYWLLLFHLTLGSLLQLGKVLLEQLFRSRLSCARLLERARVRRHMQSRRDTESIPALARWPQS